MKGLPRNLSLGARFNFILILIFASLMTFNAIDDYYRQNALIRQDAIDTSRMMARQIIETRSYLSSALKDEARINQDLIPQVASTRIAAAISSGTQYTLRQTSLRYRNPGNSPDAYESAVLESFNQGKATEHFELTSTGGKEILRYLVPMIADRSCLGCHGTYESAPDFVRQRFPKGHSSYNYRVGEVIGAISVSIPMYELRETIGRNLKRDIIFSGVIVLLILIMTGFLIRRFVIAPVSRLSATISDVTRTGAFETQLPVRGTDEISRLITAYNSMINELNSKRLQRQESDDRYRNMIDMARSAIVTFIKDGKIVIVNRSAERLLGIARTELIGADIFSFLSDGDSFKKELSELLADDNPWEGSTFTMQIKDCHGFTKDVELAVSATVSDGRHMFTAIIRETGPR